MRHRRASAAMSRARCAREEMRRGSAGVERVMLRESDSIVPSWRGACSEE